MLYLAPHEGDERQAHRHYHRSGVLRFVGEAGARERRLGWEREGEAATAPKPKTGDVPDGAKRQ